MTFFALRPEGQFTPLERPSDHNNSFLTTEVLTWNIMRSPGEHPWQAPWPERKEAFVSILTEEVNADIICLQEVCDGQLEEFGELLPGYGHYLTAGESEDSLPEKLVIFYRMDRWILKKKQTLWLSDTPGQPSKGVGALYPRPCLVLDLEDTLSQEMIRVVNVHMPLTRKARKAACQILVAQLKTGNPQRLIIAGDFNMPHKGSGMRALYARPLQEAEQSGALTYHLAGKGLRCLDHILIGSGWSVIDGEIIKQKGRSAYPSDHFGLWAKLHFSTGSVHRK